MRNRTLSIALIVAASLASSCLAQKPAWQPAPGHTTLKLWPHGAPGAPANAGPEIDTTTAKDNLIAGKPLIRLGNVTDPTLTVYAPKGKSTGAAVVVFPGGGYRILAIDLEGTEVCDWLNKAGVTCILVKYRVPGADQAKPSTGPYPKSNAALQDAQRSVSMVRAHAAEWHIDPKRIGVLGFSAGAHLAAVLSIHSDFESKTAVKEHGGLGPTISARPDFAFILYPGYLVHWPDKMTIAPEAVPTAATPPTFLLQAENDSVHEENALIYFQALKDAKVPAEIHLFAEGGHGYGLRPTDLPITHWPALAETWLRTIHILN